MSTTMNDYAAYLRRLRPEIEPEHWSPDQYEYLVCGRDREAAATEAMHLFHVMTARKLALENMADAYGAEPEDYLHLLPTIIKEKK